VAKILTSGWYY